MMNRLLDKQKITLYCLPFAGGNALSYRNFKTHITDIVDIKPLDLPGRGKRIKEPLLTNLEAIADDTLHQIKNDLNGQPYAVYGHSMGAVLGYVLTHRLINADLPLPMHLFFSGRRAPSVVDYKPQKHGLPKKDFLDYLQKLGGLPGEILENAELMDFFEPILRADFQAIETYIHKPTSPFDIPMTIMHGLKDKDVTHAELLPWQQETRQPISIKSFTGGHFFIFEHLPHICRLFSKTLTLVHA
ncbi:thioesterase domain-containing protein [Candidatus Parabeggiatoa sp. HSG14]|uniref:thioesterase II family protein n=1 Tax=Candidatus Parabeggiatoa sp. HSG14 TaxID=3055593 RepID=UPI0025A84417|nr:thioesterase domain-containing protein [Thiotrichales bacterium HSG14]